jgi:hypothetical protein
VPIFPPVGDGILYAVQRAGSDQSIARIDLLSGTVLWSRRVIERGMPK